MTEPHEDHITSEVQRAIAQPVSLADHDPRWRTMFEDEKRRLMDALPGTFLAIEHIGSTAVDGMKAKPLIDLLAGVDSMETAIALNRLLVEHGYTTSASLNDTLPTRQWFMRQEQGVRTHHLHVVVHDSDEWRMRIGFRDALRADPELRRRYTALKEDLVARYAEDRDAYTEGKGAFIAQVKPCRSQAS